MDELTVLQAEWAFADRKQAQLMRYINAQFTVLEDEIQAALDRFGRLDLLKNLDKAKVQMLHRKIREWKAGKIGDRQLQRYLRDLENRSRITGDEALFVWLYALYAAAYRRIIDRNEQLLGQIAADTQQRVSAQAAQITGQLPAAQKIDLTPLLDHLPDGTRYRDKLSADAQYAAKRVTDAARQAKQQGSPPEIARPAFSKPIQAAKNRLLKPSQPRVGQAQGYHGYLDQVMTAVVGYTTMDVFRRSGVEQYRFIATIDERTTSACRRLHGRIFRVSKMRLGVNVPPVTVTEDGQPIPHPCRSVIRAMSTAEQLRRAIRAAGDEKQQQPHTFRQLGSIDITDEKAIELLLETFIQKFENSSREYCLVIAKNGDVFLVNGDEYTVDTSLLGNRMEGSINIHNHPENATQYSFSPKQDLPSFYEDGSARMLAFDKRYVYELRRPHRMPLREEFDKVVSLVWSKRWDFVNALELPLEEYSYNEAHAAIQEICRRLGIDYERRPRA